MSSVLDDPRWRCLVALWMLVDCREPDRKPEASPAPPRQVEIRIDAGRPDATAGTVKLPEADGSILAVRSALGELVGDTFSTEPYLSADGSTVVYCVPEDTGVTGEMEMVCHVAPVGGVDRAIKILTYDESVALNEQGGAAHGRVVAQVRARAAEVTRAAGPAPRVVHRTCRGVSCRSRLAEARFDEASGRLEIVAGTRTLLSRTLVPRVRGKARSGEPCQLMPEGFLFHVDEPTGTVIVRMRFDEAGANKSHLCWSRGRRPLVSESEVYVLRVR